MKIAITLLAALSLMPPTWLQAADQSLESGFTQPSPEARSHRPDSPRPRDRGLVWLTCDSVPFVSTHGIYGPYGDRVCAIRFGGHNGDFKDLAGRWHATAWCYPDSDPHWQRVTLLGVAPGGDGLFRVVRSRKDPP